MKTKSSTNLPLKRAISDQPAHNLTLSKYLKLSEKGQERVLKLVENYHSTTDAGFSGEEKIR